MLRHVHIKVILWKMSIIINILDIGTGRSATSTKHGQARAYKTFFMLNSIEHEIFLLLNVKMPTVVGILTFMSGKNSILCLSEPKKCLISLYFYTYEHLKFHAQLS